MLFLVSTPRKPINYQAINGNLFELADQLAKRIEAGEMVVEIALDSETLAIEVEERLNYFFIRRGFPLLFSLSLTRPDVYRVELESLQYED